MAEVVEHEVDATGLKLGIAVARFNDEYTEPLLVGALEKIRLSGGDPEESLVVWVPGAFELPLAALKLAQTGRYDAVVALGVVIRGQTPHFDYVCRAAADGLLQAQLRTGVPISFGVLTCETHAQARDRSATGPQNKGFEATQAAIAMVKVLRDIEG